MPTALQECSNEVIPSLLMLFDGLKRAYEGSQSYTTKTSKFYYSEY